VHISFSCPSSHKWVTERAEREPLKDRVEVLVIGAGFGGLLAATRLRQEGVDSIRLMDEAGDVGGTWYWNRYPGIHCDIESYVYMPLLEEVGYVPNWLTWNEEAEEWVVRTDRGDLFTARFVVTSSGTLTQPKLPGIPGIETFRGAYVPHQPLGLRIHGRHRRRRADRSCR
jgi:cation diffusion facilitator CzcD-associated flavoprotein CzcO